MLEASQILAYTAALGVAALIPGPGMVALVTRSVSAGALPGFFVLFGLIVGDLIYLSFAVFGLTIIVRSFSALFVAVRWASALYLFYLAWQFWHANNQPVEVGREIKKKELASAWLSGLSITLGNPKTIAFYLALLPFVIDLGAVSLQSWGFVLLPLTILVLLSVGAMFVFCAIAVRDFLSSQNAQRLVFRGAATIMVLAASAMLFKE